MRAVDLDDLRTWLDRYFAAWRSNDAAEVEALFAPDAVYSYGPLRGEAHGRDEIVRRWVEGGVQPDLRTAFEPLAVAGDRGVAHWQVSFDDGDGRTELDGILVLDFDAEGRCVLHREWYEERRTPS
jgi:ketosteroid isomerase-like protein